MSRPAPTRTRKKPARIKLTRRGCLLTALIVGGVFSLVVTAGALIYLGLQYLPSRDETPTGMPVEVVKLTPTVGVYPSPSPSSSPLPIPDCETIVSSDDVETAVPLPISLTVGSESFPISPVVLQEEEWAYPASHSGSAAWICGTVVNYVVGLEPTSENRSLLTDLRPGDDLKVRLSNGVELLFRFVERREVAANESSVFRQTRPRLTLIVAGEDDTWQIATADYVSETESVSPPSGTLVEMGQPVRVGDAQVTVLRGYANRSAPDLQPGTMYYVVELAVENVGQESLDADAFVVKLRDSVSNEYLRSPAASAVGEYGPLEGEIEPGSTVQGAIGYVVPTTLAGPELILTFSPWPGSELQARVSIPYEGEPEPSSVSQAEVTITDAFLSRDGSVLIIEGEIQNTGSGVLNVTLDDVSLTSSAGMSALRSAAPPLPWEIQPGELQVVELQYDRPEAATALLTLLGYSFEIRGL